MNLVKDGKDLFQDNIQIKKIDTKLSTSEIKECMYKYKMNSLNNTVIEFNELDGRTVLLKGKNEEEIKNDWQCLNDIVKKIVSNRKEDNRTSKFENKSFINRKDKNYARPYEVLKSKDINQYANSRLYLTGDIASLMDIIDRYILKFARQEKAINFYAEPLWSEDELEKFGYSKENDNLLGIKKFDDGANMYWQNATCDNIWESIANNKFENFKAYTSLGVCCRAEKNQTYFLERMNVFHMREIVAVGKKEDIVKYRERAIKFVVDFANKLNLNFSLEEASDPFFIEDNNSFENNNSKIELPDVVKVEFRPELYDNKSLACASFNIHGDFFSKKFNYTGENKDEALWTSCIAFGLERWCWAILIQFGTDSSKWPDLIKQMLI